MTPAQEAKQYAADNGFTIQPCLDGTGRRYNIFHASAKIGDECLTNVGGYPAALNFMKRYVAEFNAAIDAAVIATGFPTSQSPIKVDHASLDDVVYPSGACSVLITGGGGHGSAGGNCDVLIDPNTPHGNPNGLLMTMGVYREVNEALNQKPPRLYPTIEAVAPTKYEIAIKVYPIARGLQITQHDTKIALSGMHGNFGKLHDKRADELELKWLGARTGTWTLVIDGLCADRGFSTRADALKRLRRLYNSIIGSYYRNAKCIIIREV